ncbi:MAG TPA: hypothetical protein VGF82_19740 [Terracidiphilus sp.]
MGTEILRPDDPDEAPTSSPEVEFALVLSRMIESVRNDPEHLRATVYELARHKMKEQSVSRGRAERKRVLKALETAIQGVETFAKNNEYDVLARPAADQPRALAPPRVETAPRVEEVGPVASVIDLQRSHWSSRRRGSRFAASWRLASVIAIVFTIVLVATQRERVRNQIARVEALFRPVTPKSVEVAAPPVAPATNMSPLAEPATRIPTTYGIYAISGDKLYELELLPGRAPDIRVAVSAAIQTASRTTLPDGHLKFVVYRRDSATNAADHAEVRIVAKIERETGFDPAGKPLVKKTEDTWVIRNISIPFRTAPKKDNPDMYEVQSEDPEAALTPGRYALVLKGQAYDFSVAGSVTDPRQCLERFSATNGQFYSECRKQ